jgi:hypothetical protein
MLQAGLEDVTRSSVEMGNDKSVVVLDVVVVVAAAAAAVIVVVVAVAVAVVVVVVVEVVVEVVVRGGCKIISKTWLESASIWRCRRKYDDGQFWYFADRQVDLSGSQWISIWISIWISVDLSDLSSLCSV